MKGQNRAPALALRLSRNIFPSPSRHRIFVRSWGHCSNSFSGDPMASISRANKPRPDVLATQSTALSRAADKAARANPAYVPPADRGRRRAHAEADKRFRIRKEFLEPPRSDPNGFERLIGESDLMSINFDRGRRASAAVCRIKVPSDGGAWYGTGFLVGPAPAADQQPCARQRRRGQPVRGRIRL